MKRRLPGTVIALGIVSFLNDLSSEMIYPLLPLYLTTVVGASAIALGLIEGVAESAAALLKWVSGHWSDKVRSRKPFVVTGYTIAGIVRPCIGLASHWGVVLGLRFGDRVGKGLRTSPRDALIADVTDPDARGRAFGFHRSMDHAGAVAGPFVAAALMHWAGFSLRQIFLFAAVPAAMVILLVVFRVREKARKTKTNDLKIEVDEPRKSPSLPSSLKRFHWALAIFTLGNASDAFLLLLLGATGFTGSEIALIWGVHNLVKLIAAYLAGYWTDATGYRLPIVVGWMVHVFTYLAFALSLSSAVLVIVFLIYGFANGLTEPAEKALVADLTPEDRRGTGFGIYHGIIGAAALPASAVFGWVWYTFSPSAAFLMDALLAFTGLSLFAFGKTREQGNTPG